MSKSKLTCDIERRDNKDGYVYIKVENSKRWQLKHRYLWEQVNGKIPKGYILVFKDRDKYNIKLDNLMLITRSECLIMNKQDLFSENKEITETGALIAKVIDKVNKKQKEGE